LQAAQEQLQKKNQELVDLYRDKSKKLTQMTNLYNLLKARAMKSRMETAASENVSQTLNTISSRTGPAMPPAQPGTSMPNIQKARTPKTHSFHFSPEGVEQLHRYQRSGTGSSKMSRPQMGGKSAMPPPGGHAVFNIRTGESHISPLMFDTDSSCPAQTNATNQQHRTRLPHQNRPPTVTSQLPPENEILARFGN
jgi:E3 ubiquitin-protein ligase CCNP1IP1